MKKLLFLAAATFAALSCTTDETADATTPDGGDDSQNQEITITVSTSGSDVSSRVEFDTNSDGDILVTWAEDDALGAWVSGATSFSKFTMDSDSMSADGETADFTGTDPNGEFRLIHPYTTTAISGDSFTLDLAAQTPDMADDGFNNMSSATYMISDVATSSSQPAMKHMAAAIRVAMRFDNLAAEDLSITSITLGGGDGIDLPTAATVDLTSDVTASDFLTTTAEGAITATVENSPTVAEYSSDETYTVMLNVLPFSISSGQNIALNVELANESGSDTYNKSFTITFDEDVTFDRATHTTLAYTCDMEAAASSTLSAPVIAELTTAGTLDLAEPIVWSATTGATYDVYLKVDGGSYSKIVSGWDKTSYIIPNSYMSSTLVTGAYSYSVYVVATTSDETFTSNTLTFKPAMTGTITDIRGDETNTYGWVRIGPRVWLSESLQTAYFNDGEAIPYLDSGALDPDNLSSSTTASEAYYNPELYGYDHAHQSFWTNDSQQTLDCANIFSTWDEEKYIEKTGYVYSYWTAANDRLAPEGWHTSTYDEWADLLSDSSQVGLNDTYIKGLGSAATLSEAKKIIHTDYQGATNTLGLGLTPTATRASSSTEYGGVIPPFRNGLWQYQGSYWLIHEEYNSAYLDGTLSWETIALNSTERLCYRLTIGYYGSDSWQLTRNTWAMGYLFAVRCIMDDDLN